MTITMQDAVYTPSLSSAYGAFAAYVDGQWPSAAYVLSHFPNAYHLFLTTGLGAAEGIDVEPGNQGWNNNCAAVPGWVQNRIAAGVARPVIYISCSSAAFIVSLLGYNGIPRSAFRLFTAHWTNEAHICTSADCQPGPIAWRADATQFEGNIGGLLYGYDLSLCVDNFFNTAAIPVTPTPPVPKPAPVPIPEEEDSMEYLVEASGPTVKAQATHPLKYPAVSAEQVYVVDPAQNLKYQVFGAQLPLYVALMPPARQFLNTKARPCAEIAAVPSS